MTFDHRVHDHNLDSADTCVHNDWGLRICNRFRVPRTQTSSTSDYHNHLTLGLPADHTQVVVVDNPNFAHMVLDTEGPLLLELWNWGGIRSRIAWVLYLIVLYFS